MVAVADKAIRRSDVEPSRRLRFRFGLRTLLIVTTVLCVALGLILRDALEYKRHQRDALALIAARGGSVQRIGWSIEPSRGSNWLSRMVLDIEHPEPLWHVDLTGATLSKTDLATLARCEWIRALTLAKTQITDADLAPLTKLTKLRQLDVSDSAVSDEAVTQLARLSRLVVLRTEGSKISYDGLAKLDRVLPGRFFEDSLAQTKFPQPGVSVTAFHTFLPSPRLDDEFGLHLRVPDGRTSIHVTNAAALTPAAIDGFRHLTTTRSFTAGFGDKRFADVDVIANWQELRSLSLDGGQLTDDDFGHIAALPKLKYLSLYGMHNISDRAFEKLGEHGTLIRLDLVTSSTTIDVTEHLGGLKQLQVAYLSLWQKNTSGEYEAFVGGEAAAARQSLRRLRALPRLEKLRLYGNVFSGEVISELTNFKKLKQIGYDERFVSREVVETLKASLPDCEIRSRGFTDSIDLN